MRVKKLLLKAVSAVKPAQTAHSFAQPVLLLDGPCGEKVSPSFQHASCLSSYRCVKILVL